MSSNSSKWSILIDNIEKFLLKYLKRGSLVKDSVSALVSVYEFYKNISG